MYRDSLMFDCFFKPHMAYKVHILLYTECILEAFTVIAR